MWNSHKDSVASPRSTLFLNRPVPYLHSRSFYGTLVESEIDDTKAQSSMFKGNLLFFTASFQNRSHDVMFQRRQRAIRVARNSYKMSEDQEINKRWSIYDKFQIIAWLSHSHRHAVLSPTKILFFSTTLTCSHRGIETNIVERLSFSLSCFLSREVERDPTPKLCSRSREKQRTTMRDERREGLHWSMR